MAPICGMKLKKANKQNEGRQYTHTYTTTKKLREFYFSNLSAAVSVFLNRHYWGRIVYLRISVYSFHSFSLMFKQPVFLIPRRKNYFPKNSFFPLFYLFLLYFAHHFRLTTPPTHTHTHTFIRSYIRCRFYRLSIFVFHFIA